MAKRKILLNATLVVCVAILVIAIASVSHGQTISPSTDPSRVRQQQSIISPNAQEDLDIKLGGDNAAPPEIFAPSDAEKFEFVLNDILINNLTAYKENHFDFLFENLKGQKTTIAKIYEIANAITKEYHGDGYVFSRALIPEQEIENGVVQILVVEGYIDNINLQNELPSSYLMDGPINLIKQSRPLNIRDLERAILLIESLPGQNAQAILEPKRDEESDAGAIDLNIFIRKKPPQFSASIDNNGSRFIGPWQGGAVAVLPHDFLYKGETAISSFVANPFDELRYGSISEKIPLTSDGLTVKLSVQKNLSEPGSRLKTLELKNKFRSFKIDFQYPLILTRSEKLSPTLSFETNDSVSDVLGTRFYRDKLSVLRVGFNHQFADTYSGVNSYDLIVSQGLNVLGARETGSLDLSRSQGESDFTKITLDASRTQRFGSLPISFKLGLSGQYTKNKLLSSEEIGYGGSQFGRAYDNSEITGDSGVKTSLELSHDAFVLAPKIAAQPFVYYDFAKLWNYDRGSSDMSGSSAGFGLRTSLNDNLLLTTTIAQPLNRSQANPLYGNGKNPRFMLSLQYNF